MGRGSFGALGGRILAVIGGIVLVGIVLRLIGAILSPILPPWFMHALTGGWGMLLGIISPALPAMGALAILAAICWVIIGRGR